jgi:hypothetical protein
MGGIPCGNQSQMTDSHRCSLKFVSDLRNFLMPHTFVANGARQFDIRLDCSRMAAVEAMRLSGNLRDERVGAKGKALARGMLNIRLGCCWPSERPEFDADQRLLSAK